MNRILIIKLGALGDVIRTTPLLRVLKGEITWVTQPAAVPLLRKNPFIHQIVPLKKDFSSLLRRQYDLVLNLDEDVTAVELATLAKKSELVGPYGTPSGTRYTDSSADWFDMSLISRLGKKKADQKKWRNRRTYQEILFEMVGKKFKGEEYILPVKGSHQSSGIVGLEARSGERWVAKRWPRFEEFIELLNEARMPYLKFKQFPTLEQFIHHINKTEFVITTDSLSLHIALGLRKKVAAIFTCTSPHEIYGYDRNVKIVSPLLKKYFYSTEKTLKPGKAIAPKKVFKALQELTDGKR